MRTDQCPIINIRSNTHICTPGIMVFYFPHLLLIHMHTCFHHCWILHTLHSILHLCYIGWAFLQILANSLNWSTINSWQYWSSRGGTQSNVFSFLQNSLRRTWKAFLFQSDTKPPAKSNHILSRLGPGCLPARKSPIVSWLGGSCSSICAFSV